MNHPVGGQRHAPWWDLPLCVLAVAIMIAAWAYVGGRFADILLDEPTPVPYVQDATDERLEHDTDAPEFVPTLRVEICPVTAYDNAQGVLDTGVAVLVEYSGTPWIAGHNTSGWDWFDEVEPSTLVEVTCGPEEGLYEAYENRWQEGLSIPTWVTEPDLVMQTCTGLNGEPKGIGFTLLMEVS